MGPASQEAEESVIGACLLSADAFDTAAEIINPEDFYDPLFGSIWEAFLALHLIGKPLDPVVVAEYLKEQGTVPPVFATLVELKENVPSTAAVEYYAAIVRDKAVLRKLSLTAALIRSKVEEDYGADTAETLDWAEGQIFAITQSHDKSVTENTRQMLPECLQALNRAYARNEELVGLSTGFVNLDRITGGFQRANLILLAGRPGTGKTACALAIAQAVALDQGIGVAMFSLEMSRNELMQRILLARANISHDKIKRGRVLPRELRRMAYYAAQLAAAPLWVDDTASLNVLELRSRCRKLARDKRVQLGLVIVDYLQLMRGMGEMSREQQIATISRNLKILAKDLDVPILALSQLNRQSEQRADRRPQVSDLRESGGLEQDADLVGLLYRDETYNPETGDAGITELIIGKQRNGPTGTCRLFFLDRAARFTNFMPAETGVDSFGAAR